MIKRVTVRMSLAKRALFAIAAVTAIAVTGFVAAEAQTGAKAQLPIEAMAQERAQRLAEQRLPRTVAPFDPQQFDRYAGMYQVYKYEFFAFTREGEHFFGSQVGAPEDQKLEIYPESPTKFFSKAGPLQIDFVADATGKLAGIVMHAKGVEIPGHKVSEAVAKAALAERAARIKNRTPNPGTENALRRYIEAFQHGQPNYDDMIPIAALLTYERLQKYADYFQKWGALKSLTFVEVNPRGNDQYLAIYEHGRAEMTVEPLSPDGKSAAITIGKVETQ